MPSSNVITRKSEVLDYEVEINGFTFADDVEIDLEDEAGEVFTLVLDGPEVRPFVDAILEVQAQTEPDQPEIPFTPIGSIRVAESQINAFIAAQKAVRLDYTRSDGERVTRVVSPYQVKEIKDFSGFAAPKFLVGFEKEGNGIRNFRLSRINGIAPAAEEYRPEGG